MSLFFVMRRFLPLLLLAAAFLPGAMRAAPFTPEQIEFFETSVRPVLAESCVECHNGTKAEAGLRLDTREFLLKGGHAGQIVKTGAEFNASKLLLSIRHEGGKDLEPMPYKKPKLSQESIDALTRWVQMNMPWPDDAARAAVVSGKDPRNHWSFKPLKVEEVPPGTKNPIDYFIQKQLKAAKLTQAPKADTFTLIRRAYYDLTGLPPTFEEVEKWKSRPLTELVDHLQASQTDGERWAWHWMDVARYSDVKGYVAGGLERRYIYSYTYRDWLIRAFNADMPYDQFILNQLAADQLVKPDEPANLAAMGFLTLAMVGRKELMIDDQIDTTFRGMMGLTVSCARCHDHKFDPIPTRDYYSLYGVFMNSEEPNELPLLGKPQDTPEYRDYLAKVAEKEKIVDEFYAPRIAKLAMQFPDLANRPFQLEAKFDGPDRRELEKLRSEVDRFIANSPHAPDRALVLKDKEKNQIGQPVVFVRGNPGARGEKVPRRFLSAVAGDNAPEFKEGSGRLEMARAIVDPKNPLTARVIVNRVWKYHFERGIVATVSDFGIQGELPTHPALLDYLANWFMQNGWSIKKLNRLILSSETWQQSAVHPKAEAQGLIDPENRLLWRQNRSRLDFESMRDSILAVNGSLDRKFFGRPVEIEKAPYSSRRTIYAFIDRQNLPPMFQTFDFASPLAHTPQRPYTTIPTQGLFTLNNPFVLEHAKKLAAKSGDTKTPAADRIRALYRLTLGRDPDAQELQLGESFVTAELGGEAEDPAKANRQTATSWQYGYGTFDPGTKKGEFTVFPNWTGKQWQPEEKYPVENSKLNYVHLDEFGGHPGSEGISSAIRWTAPFDMTVQVDGAIRKPSPNGDPVRARIVKNGTEMLAEFVCQNAQEVSTPIAAVKVSAGDTVDFLVDSYGHGSHDSYSWAPKILNVDQPAENWDYTEEFGGPGRPASTWEIYAHALMATNQFMFVD